MSLLTSRDLKTDVTKLSCCVEKCMRLFNMVSRCSFRQSSLSPSNVTTYIEIQADAINQVPTGVVLTRQVPPHSEDVSEFLLDWPHQQVFPDTSEALSDDKVRLH